MNDTNDARTNGYLTGASAVRTEAGWVVLTPCPEAEATPLSDLDGCAIITASNLWAEQLPEETNRRRQDQLRRQLLAHYENVREAAGGQSFATWPWPGDEQGYCVHMSREEAAAIGREHDQEAVYVIEGDKRVLVFCDDRESIEQHYRAEHLNQTTQEGAS